MPGLLVDTAIMIDHLRGREEATTYLSSLFQRGERLFASTICKAEVLAGMREAEEKQTLAFLGLFSWVPVDEEVAEAAGRLAREQRSSNPGIDLADYLIAATAQIMDADLVTLNERHFPTVKRVTRPY